MNIIIVTASQKINNKQVILRQTNDYQEVCIA